MSLFKKKSEAEILSEMTETEETVAEETAAEPAKVKKPRIINKSRMKYGTYALGITAIVIAAAVAVNVLFGILASRVNLNIDLSLEGENTLTEDNIAFLESLETEVTLTVCATAEDYTGGYLDYYTANQVYSATDSTGEYYAQTIRFLELYQLYSDKIKVEFVDPQTPEFATVMQEYSSTSLNYGDIIVEAVHTVDGEENKRSTIVGFDDLYYLADDSGYASMGYDYYYVSGNYFETAVSSAIKKVSATETIKVGVVSTHCNTSAAEYYTGVLGLNNFEMMDISGAVIETVSDELSMLIIAAPTEDFAISELEAIDTWLYNNGQRGRGLLFFASISSPSLPNLYSYLEEWGISVGSGVLFDTNSQSHMSGDPMTMLFVPTTDSNDTVDAVNGSSSSYIIGSAVPLSVAFENNGTRNTFVPMSTYSDIVVAAPVGTAADWTPPSDYTTAQYPGMIVSCDDEYVDNVLKQSYVVAFASESVVSADLASYSSIGNMDAAVNTANLVSGVEDSGFSFYMKTIDTESYYDQVTQSGADAITIIFQWGIPLLLVVWGIVVFVRRSRK